MARPATKVSVQIGQSPQREYRDLETYTLDSNILTLVDSCSFQLTAAQGLRLDEIGLGDPVSIFMSNPAVSGGRDVQILKGLVVELTDTSDNQGGCTLNVVVSDLGWHLVNNSGPLFKSIAHITFAELLRLSIDSSWGFAGVRTDNDRNRRLLQGKALIQAPTTDAFVPLPPICFEAGDSIADKLILYARRAKQLVNVSSDGYLQVFSPNYGQQGAASDPNGISGTDFTVHHHRTADAARRYNNVKKAMRKRSIDGIYTQILCVGTIVNTTFVGYAKGDQHPGTFKGSYSKPDALPFKRLLTFSDGEVLTRQFANDHAQRKGQRGLFDALTLEYTVEEHAQGSVFITPDCMVGVDDSIRKIKGAFYLSARRFMRTLGGGTLTQLTLKSPNLLHGGSA